MELNTLNKLDAAEALVRSVSGDLDFLASAFYTTGNDRVAAIITTAASDLRMAADEVRQATGEAVHSSFAASEEATMNLITGILAVASQMSPADD